MTSKACYLKIILDSAKRRIWYGAVAFLALFFAMPLYAMLEFESKAQIYEYTYITEEITYAYNSEIQNFTEFVSGVNPIIIFIVCAAALLGAWSGLSWLHSRRKMDLYGCLPIRREELFFVESVATFLLFFIPYIINLILTLLVGVTKEIFSFGAIQHGLIGILIYILMFLTFYFVAAIAMLLTGKVLTGILGTGVILGIGPMIYAMLQELPIQFYETYVADSTLFAKLLPYLSPVGTVITLAERMQVNGKDNTTLVTEAMILLIVFGIGGALVSIWLIKKRPAEGAEQSMIFPKTEGIIKAIILYPMGIAGGIFFDMLGDRNRFYGWFWFGLLLSLGLTSILIEVIYHVDRKRIFDHKFWTGVSSATVILTCLCFALDITGYDQWIPDKDRVANMTLEYRQWQYSNEVEGCDYSYQYLEKYLDELNGACVYELAKEGIENLDNDQISEREHSWATVVYKMKDGSVKKREYRLFDESLVRAEKELYQEKVYKQAQIPILLIDDETIEVDGIWMKGSHISMDELNANQLREVAQTYIEEISHMNYEEIYQAGSGIMEFVFYPEDLEYSKYMDGTYPLNENFAKTCALLNSFGVELPLKWPDVEKIRYVTVEYYQENGDAAVDETPAEQSVVESYDVKEITDPEQIEEILEDLICTSELATNYLGPDIVDKQYDVYIEYVPDVNREIYSTDGAYLKGKVPECVKNLFS